MRTIKVTLFLFQAAAWLLLAAMTLAISTGSAKASPSIDVKFLMTYSHTSDIMRGNAPWARHEPEPYQDYIGLGATFVFGPRFEIDLTHGRKLMGGVSWDGLGWESGTQATVRFYPLRRK